MNNTQSFQSKLIKGSLTALILSFLGSVFAYLIRIFYSRVLSIDDYGLFYAVLGLYLIFTTYFDLGFGYSVVYFFPKYFKQKNYKKAWNIFVYGQAISIGVSIIISLILIAAAPFLANNYFKVPGSEPLIYISSVFLIAFSLINGLIQIYSALQKERYYASITAVRWGLTLVLSLIFYLLNFPYLIFFAIAWAAGHFLTALIYFFLLYKNHAFLTVNKILLKKETFKQMYSYAIPSFLETFITSIIGMTIIFFLTAFAGVREVGIYNIIYPLASIPLVLLAPLNTLILPLVSHLMEGEKRKLEYLLEKILEMIPFIGTYFSLFIILFPSASVALIFGEKWIGKVELSLSILCLGVIILMVGGILGAIALGIGKVKKRLKLTTIVSFIIAPVTALLIFNYGVLGAIISTVIMAVMTNLVFIIIIKEDLSFVAPFSLYIKLLFFSVSLFALVRVFKISPEGWVQFIIYGIIYSMIYFMAGFILKIYDRRLLLIVLTTEGKKANSNDG